MGKEGGGSNSASCFVYALVCVLAPDLESAVAEGRERDCDMTGQNSPTRAVDNRLRRPSRKLTETYDTYLPRRVEECPQSISRT